MKKYEAHRIRVGIKHNFLKFIYQLKSMTFAKYILFWYSCITLIGALLLWLPFSQTGYTLDKFGSNPVEHHISFVDALFTSASAFSDTGLSTQSAAITFNMFGQAVIATLIFIGGIGWFALKVYIFNIIFGRPLSFRSRANLNAERGTAQVGVSRELIKVAVTTLLILTILASVVLSIYFYLTPTDGFYDATTGAPTTDNAGQLTMHTNPYHNPYTSLRWGVFHSISALNNAGFDIIGNSSLQPYYSHYGVQIIFIILFVVGGVGYPVIYDVYTWSKKRYHGERFTFSLFTKISTIAYLVISLVGLAVVFAIETTAHDSFWDPNAKDVTNTGHYGTKGDKVMALFFNTMSTRNAGFSTINMHDLSKATLIQYVVMMFIGSAPSSTAGGIRTTTFAVIVLAVYSLLRGRSSVYAFKKQIDKQTVNRAFIVFVFSVILVIVGTLISITSLDTNGGEIPTLAGTWDHHGGTTILNNVPVDADMTLHGGAIIPSGTTVTGDIALPDHSVIHGVVAQDTLLPPQTVIQKGISFSKDISVPSSYIPSDPGLNPSARPYDFSEVLFEVSSAFGTTGLSAGITPMLSVYSKVALIIIMFIGQLGVSSSLLVFGKRKSDDKHYKRVVEDVSIG